MAYNGQLISFALDDVYQSRSGEKQKSTVVTLISEPETVEGVCRYLLAEIEKIKKASNATTLRDVVSASDGVSVSAELEAQSKLGPRLGVLKSEHGTD